MWQRHLQILLLLLPPWLYTATQLSHPLHSSTYFQSYSNPFNNTTFYITSLSIPSNQTPTRNYHYNIAITEPEPEPTIPSDNTNSSSSSSQPPHNSNQQTSSTNTNQQSTNTARSVHQQRTEHIAQEVREYYEVRALLTPNELLTTAPPNQQLPTLHTQYPLLPIPEHNQIIHITQPPNLLLPPRDVRYYCVWLCRAAPEIRGIWAGNHPDTWQSIVAFLPNRRYSLQEIRLCRCDTFGEALESYTDQAYQYGSPIPPVIHRVGWWTTLTATQTTNNYNSTST